MIRDQVLRAIAENREPGLHFAGNFLGLSWDHVQADETCLSLDGTAHRGFGRPAQHRRPRDARRLRARELHARDPAASALATVSMTIELTDAPRTGRLHSSSHFQGFIREGKGRVGKSEVEVTNGKQTVCVGTGAFMALDPPSDVKLHPVPHRRREYLPPVPALKEEQLDKTEKQILAHADAALKDPHPSFIERFWGFLPHRTATELRARRQMGRTSAIA